MEKGKCFLGAAAVTAAAGTAFLLRSEYEKSHFVVESTEIASPKIRGEHLFVFLTDLHDREFGEDNGRLLCAVKNLRPQAVFIGGDTMITKPGKGGLSVTALLLDGLSEIAPVYYANGNHEQRLLWEAGRYPGKYEVFTALLGQCGVHYLSDSSALLGDDIRVSGLNIEEKYYRSFHTPRLPVSAITDKLGEADPYRYQILLAHSPLFFSSYAGWGADLTLAGHFHGGTVRLPLLGGVMTPQFQFFSPFCAGTFRQGSHVMVVSRGLGTHTVNIRLANRPQICVLSLTPSAG